MNPSKPNPIEAVGHSEEGKSRQLVDQQYLNSILAYETDTGELFRKTRPSNCVKVGDKAGWINQRDGYVRIKIFGENYLAHRVIWVMVYGKWPEKHLDHIDRNRANNRLSNLREANPTQNACNRIRSVPAARPFRGVSSNRAKTKKRFYAYIKVGRERRHLGTFECPVAAAMAYDQAAIESFGEFAQPNFPQAPKGDSNAL